MAAEEDTPGSCNLLPPELSDESTFTLCLGGKTSLLSHSRVSTE